MFKYRHLALCISLMALSEVGIAQEILFQTGDRTMHTSKDESLLATYGANVDLRILKKQEESEVMFALPGATALAILRPLSAEKLEGLELSEKWQGSVFDVQGDKRSAAGEIFLMKRGGFVQARITLYERVFVLRTNPEGKGTLEEYRSIERDHPRGVAPPVLPQSRKVGKAQADSMCTDTADRIDIMVAYTEDAKEAANTSLGLPTTSGPAAIINEIAFGVGQANAALANSNAFHRFNLVRVGEVNYDEAADGGASTTLLDEMRVETDSIIDELHGWRDDSKADLVSLITAGGDCGWGYTPQTANADTTDHSAFSVVRRSCLNTNLSLGHETGHNLGALHNRENSSPSDFTPPYNHGFQKASPSSALPWRTNMAYGCSGGVSCARVTQFSNPNVNYPQVNGDPTGDPMTDSQPENNVMVFAQNDVEVAKYRCSRTEQIAANVWGKDTWADTGLEPDPNTAGEPMWRSPYIWVRNSQDTTLAYEHAHQNPDMGEDPHVYVKFQNDGNTTATGDVELYYADASTSLNSPANWTLINSQSASISTGVDVFEFPWSTLPGTGHYCLLARWNDTGTPLSFSNIDTYVRGEGGHIWRNVNIVGPDGDQMADTAERFVMRGARGSDRVFLRIETNALDTRKVPWNEVMNIGIDFDRKYIGKNPLLIGVTQTPQSIQIPLNERVKFIGPILLKPEQALTAKFIAKRNLELSKLISHELGTSAHYQVSIQQVLESAIYTTQDPLGNTPFPADVILGGVDYTLRIPAPNDEKKVIGTNTHKPQLNGKHLLERTLELNKKISHEIGGNSLQPLSIQPTLRRFY